MSSGSSEQHGQEYRLAKELSLFGKQCLKLECRVCWEVEGKQDQESEEALTLKRMSLFLRFTTKTWHASVNN